MIAELGDRRAGRERRHERRELTVRRHRVDRAGPASWRRRGSLRVLRSCPRSTTPARRSSRWSTMSSPTAYAGCTCWRGVTSTTPMPAARRSTPTSSCAAGRPPAWTSCTARRRRAAGRPRTAATATPWSAGGAGTRCSRGRRCPSWPGAWAGPTRWSRSGTACRGSHRCGTARPHLTILHHVHGPMWDQMHAGPAGRRRTVPREAGWRRRSTGARRR